MLSKHPVVHVRSHQEVRSGNSYVFSRDCLEVDLQVGDRPLTLFVNHLKSMLDQGDPKNGRRNTRSRRVLQAREVRRIVTARFGSDAGRHPFVVLGDLNDYLDTDPQGQTGISDLVRWRQVENVVGRLGSDDRWTHYYPGDPDRELLEGYHQIDYVLVSRSLAERSPAKPEIVRMGLPTGATRYTGPRFRGVGQVKPKASDHCPVVFELEL